VLSSLVIFIAMRVLPGDVAEVILGNADTTSPASRELLQSYREALGLTKPLPVQYGEWVWSLVNGQFGGRGLVQREEISAIVAARFPVTLELTLLALLLTVFISIPLGTLAALSHNRWPDYLVRVFAIAGHAVPQFWVALLLIMAFALIFH